MCASCKSEWAAGLWRWVRDSREQVRLVRAHANNHSCPGYDFNPKPESEERHYQRMSLPVGSVNSPNFALVRDDFRRSGNGGAFLAANKANDMRIAPRPLHLIRTPRSKEFDAARIYNEPDLYLRQLPRFLVGAKPLRVALQGAL